MTLFGADLHWIFLALAFVTAVIAAARAESAYARLDELKRQLDAPTGGMYDSGARSRLDSLYSRIGAIERALLRLRANKGLGAWISLLSRPDGGFLLGVLVGVTLCIVLVWLLLFLFGVLR